MSELPAYSPGADDEVAEFVARTARPKAASRPRNVRTGRTERAIKTSGTQREAAIKVQTADAKIQEFGGRAPLFGNRSRWFQVRPQNRDGYFLYPAIRETGPTVSRISFSSRRPRRSPAPSTGSPARQSALPTAVRGG